MKKVVATEMERARFVFSPGRRVRGRRSKPLPLTLAGEPLQGLFLTREEAETLLALALTSPLSGGEAENTLFAKMGDYVRRF